MPLSTVCMCMSADVCEIEGAHDSGHENRKIEPVCKSNSVNMYALI